MKRTIFFLIGLLIFINPLFSKPSTKNVPFTLSFSEKSYVVRQGRTLRVQLKANKILRKAQVRFFKKTYTCYLISAKSLLYDCYIPIECEGKVGKFPLLARAWNTSGKMKKIGTYVCVKKVTYPKARGFRVSQASLKTKLKKEESSCVKKNLFTNRGTKPCSKLKKAFRHSPKKPLWSGPFGIPSKLIRYSTPFGEIRNSPYWGRYLHKAVDIVSPVRSAVWAAHNGNIIIKERFVGSGNTVVIDHGLGIFTYYYHLDSFGNIKEGDFVRKGTLIGRIGNTGYSAGYHLHWGLSIKDMFVDPVEWTTKKFS